MLQESFKHKICGFFLNLSDYFKIFICYIKGMECDKIIFNATLFCFLPEIESFSENSDAHCGN